MKVRKWRKKGGEQMFNQKMEKHQRDKVKIESKCEMRR